MVKQRATTFIVGSIAFLIVSLIVAWKLHVPTLEEKQDYTFVEFLNDGKVPPSAEDILVGVIFGFVIGLFDALGIWIGMDNIGKIIPGSAEMKAALSGAYGNIMGITIGTVVTTVVRTRLGTRSTRRPIWLNMIGILLGTTAGIGIASVFFRPAT